MFSTYQSVDLLPWSNSATLLFFVTMAWVAISVLREVRPTLLYLVAATLFVLSQLDYFLLNKVSGTRIKASMWRLA